MQYVFFDGDKETGKITMMDLERIDNVKIIYRDSVYQNCILNRMFRFHMSQKINRIISLPFQQIWFKSLIGNSYENDEKLCFVFVAGWYSKRLVLWLKENYPNSKVVLFLRDTVNTYEKIIPGFKHEKLPSIFDLILTYNPEDSHRYGYIYSPVFISKFDENKLPLYPRSDVAFIGIAKDRLPIIHSIFELLDGYGLKCDFYITAVENKDRKFRNKIKYEEKNLPYLDYLGREVASDCIFEVIKGDTLGNTYRCWEAVYYNKKLLTNWSGIKDFPFYDPKYMLYFETAEDISLDFFTTNITVDYKYNNENSPVNIISLINKYL